MLFIFIFIYMFSKMSNISLSSSSTLASMACTISSTSSSVTPHQQQHEGIQLLIDLHNKLEEIENLVTVIMEQSTIDPSKLENLREIALSVATLERFLCDYIYTLLQIGFVKNQNSLFHNLSNKDTLRSLINQLQTLSTEQRWKLFPVGGTVSIFYCFIHVLSKIIDIIKRDYQRSNQNKFGSILQMKFILSLLAISVGYWQYNNILKYIQILSIQKPPNIFLNSYKWISQLPITFLSVKSKKNYSISAIFCFLFYRILHNIYIYRSIHSLDKLHHQLLILLRMWYLMNSLYKLPDTNNTSTASPPLLRKNLRSYTVLTEDILPTTSTTLSKKTISRKLLEIVALPRTSSLWPNQSWKFQLLKRILDIFYAAKYRSWQIRQSINKILKIIVSFSVYRIIHNDQHYQTILSILDSSGDNIVFIVYVLWYILIRPLSIAENITGNIMLKPNLDFITECWRTQDKPVLIYLTHLFLVPNLPFHSKHKPIFIQNIPCRIFSNVPIKLEIFSLTPTSTNLSTLPIYDLPPVLYILHGGGFVGKSYTSDITLWTNWLNTLSSTITPLVIVYIDYSLAPEYQYPTALNEIFTVYKWLTYHSPRVMVHGESAGGNLATALIIKCIQERQQQQHLEGTFNIPIPHALSLAYPSLNLNESASPSRGLHMSDPLIPYHLIIQLASIYVSKSINNRSNDTNHISSSLSSSSLLENTLTNPLIHPAYASDHILQQFPPIRITVGGLDPLLDESIDFITRLQRLHHPSLEYEVLRNLPHGYFNFRFLPGAQEAIGRTQNWILRQYMNNNNISSLPVTKSMDYYSTIFDFLDRDN